ncbi:PREDICTED: defensin-like protein 1 [Nicotiana attenuata]|uniref:defensin-like protein 1 n=1 Tax=Nicotiana attenuata TaxID=49451 RepID=UPI000904CE84|nr:PREDICTED: defensin-like protein 1 [Nicotiana attenuata]
MAKSQIQCAAFLALLFCFLIASSEMMQKAEALGCEKPSTTWSGPCLFSDDCNNQCINWEGAVHGECSFALGPECFCYFC